MTTLNFACKQGMRGIWPEHLVYMQDERVSISAAARVDLSRANNINIHDRRGLKAPFSSNCSPSKKQWQWWG